MTNETQNDSQAEVEAENQTAASSDTPPSGGMRASVQVWELDGKITVLRGTDKGGDSMEATNMTDAVTIATNFLNDTLSGVGAEKELAA